MKKKLLHIMIAQHNPDMQRGLESVFVCKHLDWTVFSNNYTLQKAVLNAYNDFRPDIVFMQTQQPGVIEYNTIKELKKTAFLVNWSGDVRTPLPQHYIELGKNINLTLFTNNEDVEELRKNGVKADFLQVGFDSKQFNVSGIKDTKAPEIIFMGSNYDNMFPLSKYRHEMVTALKNEFGVGFGVYGSGWGGLSNGVISNYADEAALYRGCKIAISLSHFDRSQYASDRLFRILGSGAFCLSHYYKDIEKDFEIGNDLDVFHSIDGLISEIKFYLTHPYTRNRISINGYKLAHARFTWHNFALNLAALINKNSIKQLLTIRK